MLNGRRLINDKLINGSFASLFDNVLLPQSMVEIWFVSSIKSWNVLILLSIIVWMTLSSVNYILLVLFTSLSGGCDSLDSHIDWLRITINKGRENSIVCYDATANHEMTKWFETKPTPGLPMKRLRGSSSKLLVSLCRVLFSIDTLYIIWCQFLHF